MASARGRRAAPMIGITCEAIARTDDFRQYDLLCDHRYAEAVKTAGGHPVLLPIAHRRSTLDQYLRGIDGLVIVGGDDVDPGLYDEPPLPTTKPVFEKRARFEAWLYGAGKERRLPIFGICYGMQLINVLEGGTLHQHIVREERSRGIDHQGVRQPRHRMQILPDTALAEILGVSSALVTTQHHQAVRRLADGFVPSAIAADGVIEAIENRDLPNVLAVQFHPERLPSSRITRKLFRAFVERAAQYRAKR